MSKNRVNRMHLLQPVTRKACVAFGFMALCVAPVANGWAFDWQLTHSASAQVDFTDNAGLDPDGQAESAVVPSTTYAVSGSGQGRRVLFVTNSSITARANSNTGRAKFNQAIRSFVRTELWRDRFFVDGSFSSTQQLAGVGTATSANPTANRNQQNSVTSVSISPVYQHHFGSHADGQASYRRTEIWGSGSADDASSDTAQLKLAAGRRYNAIKPSLSIAWFSLDERPAGTNSDDDIEQFSIQLGNSLQLTRKYAFLTTIGIDNVDAPSSTRDFSGFFWSAGFTGTPGPRTQFTFQVGQRYDTIGVNGSASYQMTPSLLLRLSAAQDVGTGLQRAGTQIQQLSITSQQGVLTGANGLPAGFLRGGITDRISTDQTLDLALVGTYGRNTITFGSSIERREFDRGTQNLRNSRLVFTRQLGRQTSATAGAFYRYVDDIVGEDTHAVGARLSFNYQVGQRTTLFAAVSRTDRFSKNKADEFTENAVTIGGRLTF